LGVVRDFTEAGQDDALLRRGLDDPDGFIGVALSNNREHMVVGGVVELDALANADQAANLPVGLGVAGVANADFTGLQVDFARNVGRGHAYRLQPTFGNGESPTRR